MPFFRLGHTAPWVLALWVLTSGPALANLLSNGSFENLDGTFASDAPGFGFQTVGPGGEVIPGWAVVSNNVGWVADANAFGTRASEGSFQVDLTGIFDNNFFLGALETRFAAVPGTTYRVSLDVGAVNGPCSFLDCSGPMGVRVLIPSAAAYDFTGFDPVGAGQHWQMYSFEFVANDPVTTLRIQGLSAGQHYLGLDNVVVEAVPVPEPATLLLWCTGLGWLAASARRRAAA